MRFAKKIFSLAFIAAVAAVPSKAQFRPFFALPQASGQVQVKLYPTENVQLGVSQLVTFGLPFPRGSVTNSQLAAVRVLNTSGQEIPAYVEMLTPWRHATNAAVDGQSVRVARIQIRYVFSIGYPSYETITVSWGGSARSQSLSPLTNPRNGWHLVTSGTFQASDGVWEPNVYAVLPPTWLCLGLLRPMEMEPFDSSLPPTRDDPSAMLSMNFTGNTQQQYASKNFFYTMINEDDPKVTEDNKCHYKTDYEPWLYDRSSAMYVLYFRSGFFKALREAVRAAEFYKSQLYPPGTTPDAAVGAFKLKNPNPADYIGANGTMYCYNECLAYTLWLTGDPDMAEPIRWISKVQEDSYDEAIRWSLTRGYTERHIGFVLLAHTVSYEVFGAQNVMGKTFTYKDRMLEIAENLRWHQNGADGMVPSPRVDGGLWKLGSQQGDGWEDRFVASAWLTAVSTDAMIRTYAVTEDAQTADFVRRVGTFLKAGTKWWDASVSDYDVTGQIRLVDYVTGIDGSTYPPEGATGEHALEVAATLACSYYFSLLTGKPDASLKQQAEEVYRTYGIDVNYWTRPDGPDAGKPAFRLSQGVFRKYNWLYRPSGSLSWCVGQSANSAPYNVSGWTFGDLPSLQRAVGRGAMDEVNVDWFVSEPNGSVAGSEVNPDLVVVARGAGLKVLATVTNWNNEKDDFDPAIGHAILASASMRTKHAKALRDMCLARGYDGIDLDWESLKGEDRDQFSAFVEELAGLLHAEGKLLSIAIHAKTSEPGTWDGAIAEDWSRLGAAVDEFKVMTYDYSGPWSQPGPVAPPDWMDEVMAFAETLVPAAKIRMGIPFYGYDWHGNTADGINWTDAQGLIAKYSPEVQRDPSGEATFVYTDESATAHVVFFQDRTALQAKLRVVSDKHPAIAGIAIWVLQDEDPAFWDDIVSLLRRPAPAVTTPATPSGPASGTTGTSYSYSTGGSVSSLGDPVEYQFDWKGDGTDLSSWGSATQSKTWTAAGTYHVRVRARCATHTSVVSAWSSGLSVNIAEPTETVSTPDTPSGSTSGVINTNYSFTASGSFSSLGHSIQYQFDWEGDGSDLSSWGSATQSKTWTAAGTYHVRVRARCATDTSVVSNWSDTLTVTISAAGPDLTGEWTTPVTQPPCKSTRSGQKCTIRGTVTIDNVGNRDSIPTDVNFYFSDDGVTYQEGDWFKRIALGKIKVGRAKALSLSYNLPLNQTAENRYVIAVIDKDNLVEELDKTNNIVVFGPIQ